MVRHGALSIHTPPVLQTSKLTPVVPVSGGHGMSWTSSKGSKHHNTVSNHVRLTPAMALKGPLRSRSRNRDPHLIPCSRYWPTSCDFPTCLQPQASFQASEVDPKGLIFPGKPTRNHGFLPSNRGVSFIPTYGVDTYSSRTWGVSPAVAPGIRYLLEIGCSQRPQ